MAKTHGLAIINGKRTRLNRIWRQMRQRCFNKNDSAYARYGGRGIKICPRWDNFAAFHGWALANGYREDLVIERRNNDGDYEPENCIWTDAIQQARNKRNNHIISYKGKDLPMAEWAEYLGINYSTLRSRINNLNWKPSQALTRPIRPIMKRREVVYGQDN